ncbi:unnamed protein product [Clonostachys rosea]|uniref:Xylanolytic transcriptional activator regulatory domain-containing protein n=1 Tax=Bionectria ochroleuca TaxID=29856 RepID=A0ABY6UFL3_BIOOC|nr:unnamed protein product [Clonostachys rosea]
MALPIFHGPTFLDLCNKNLVEGNNYADVGWWACLNTVIAMVIQRRAIHSDYQTVSEISWRFFKNAFSVYREIVSGQPSILSAQALLSMALFLGGTADTKTMMLVVLDAARMIQQLELHRDGMACSVEVEQRHRIFWSAYILRNVANGHFGLSSGLETIPNARLPAELPSDGVGTFITSGGHTINLFRYRVQVAIIESKATGYLTRSCSTPQIMYDCAVDLASELESLRESIPSDIRPAYGTTPSIGTDNLSLVMLHCTFYWCANIIQKVISLYHKSMHALHQDRQLHQFISLSTNAPRATIALLQMVIELPSFPDLWILLRYQLCAAVMLLNNIFQDPTSPRAKLDVCLIKNLLQYAQKIQGEGSDLRGFLRGCLILEQAGKAAIFGTAYLREDSDSDVRATISLGSQEILRTQLTFWGV